MLAVQARLSAMRRVQANAPTTVYVLTCRLKAGRCSVVRVRVTATRLAEYGRIGACSWWRLPGVMNGNKTVVVLVLSDRPRFLSVTP